MITSKARRRPALAQHLAVETFLVSQLCALHIKFKRIICNHGDYQVIKETLRKVTLSA